LNGLQQEVESLKLIYNEVVAKRAQASLLGSGTQTNVSVLAYAVPPVRPSGAPVVMLAVLGLILGAVLGAACALALEFVDQRMRAPSDAEAWLHIPTLGQIRTTRSPSTVRRLPRLQRQLPRQAGFNP
jgi:capsular polysaccharide biosynthesis protein